ncbi:MAG: GNAT family N-acetyltransferase [Tetrasphaera sp.]
MNDPRRQVRDNFITKSSSLARLLGGVIDHEGGVVTVDCGLPTDTFTVIVPRRADSGTAEIIARKVGGFTSSPTPFALWSWDVDDAARRVLAACGLRHTETHVAMVADLTKPAGDEPSVAGLSIRDVATAADVLTYGAIMADLFGDHPEGRRVRGVFERLSRLPPESYAGLRMVVASVADEPVGIGCLFLGQGTAGIYDIVTREPLRRRGIGGAVFAHLLTLARESGSVTGVLQASPDGQGIYARAGFVTVGEVHTYEPA